mmetsp:Transcript_3464/g.7721  ORF Transcript_3464/g.7721 Transcript_3464/m.7721 type:complete len:269 (+) Transcript_3464:3216-4022(+)
MGWRGCLSPLPGRVGFGKNPSFALATPGSLQVNRLRPGRLGVSGVGAGGDGVDLLLESQERGSQPLASPSWLGRSGVLAHPLPLGGVMQGCFPLRRQPRGTCVVTVAGPSLWPFVAAALGFRVATIEAPEATWRGAYTDLMSEFSPGATQVVLSKWLPTHAGQWGPTWGAGTRVWFASGSPCRALLSQSICCRPAGVGRRAGALTRTGTRGMSPRPDCFTTRSWTGAPLRHGSWACSCRGSWGATSPCPLAPARVHLLRSRVGSGTGL